MPPPMAVVGLCHLCPRPALASCFSCGRATCVVHLDEMHRLCDACRSGTQVPGPVRRA